MDELVQNLKEIIYFEGSIKSLITELNLAIQNLEYAKDNISSGYKIDDEAADLNKIKDCYDILVEKRNYLSNSCLSSINNLKHSINQSIENYQE